MAECMTIHIANHPCGFLAVGSIMSIRWVNQSAVSYEPYCTVQGIQKSLSEVTSLIVCPSSGVVKHISDVGTAYWYVPLPKNASYYLASQLRLSAY